ncbi:MAG: sugar phosphate isomerase/epimerase [Planctomycetaceae bacterium]|nr:sugar phosphate isomerase/epimerase [Planctomycetaceae bacterium]
MNPVTMFPDRRSFLQTAAGFALGSAAAPLAFGADTKRRYPYACSSINYSTLSFEEACKRISALGYEAVDIWHSVGSGMKCPHLEYAGSTLKAEGLTKVLEQNRLKLCGFSVYGTSYAKYAELLGQCGGGVAVRGSGKVSGTLSEDMKKFIESLKPDIELCEKYNSYLLIENHSGNVLLNKLDSLKAFVDINKSNRLGIALAPYHFLANKESVTEAIRVCGKQLGFIYFWTNEPGEKQMPGAGSVDMKDWFSALDAVGYSRYITPFMHHEPAPDRMDELHRQSLKYLKNLEQEH